MATNKQKTAAKKNIKKAQVKWKSMTHRQHALAQPQGRARQKVGTTGRGKFFHIEIRPKSEFKTFRIQDVGKKGGLERLAGKRSSGSWGTGSLLVSKEDAKIRKSRENIKKKSKNKKKKKLVKKEKAPTKTQPKKKKKDCLAGSKEGVFWAGACFLIKEHDF